MSTKPTKNMQLAAATPEPTSRARAKEQRRADLLAAAATLFAHRGYQGVSLDELGHAAGVSGPAVYRHFTGKPAVLAALLVGVSEGLLTGGRTVIAAAETPHDALSGLIDFHLNFALDHHAVIRVHDRDLPHLPAPERRKVRDLQREYLNAWVEQLSLIDPQAATESLHVRAHAAFGLLNSTSHSLGGRKGRAARDTTRSTLQEMAHRVLL